MARPARISVDVVALAAALGIRNREWVKLFREGLLHAQTGSAAMLERFPTFTAGDQWCYDTGYALGERLMAHPHRLLGEAILRPTPRKKKGI